MSLEEFWNFRYREQDYAYGRAPNVFLKEVIDKYQLTGKILLPAEGEGRNAAYAAKKGLAVFACDISEEGRKKAKQLAEEQHVEIHYEVGDFIKSELTKQSYGSAALIYAHFPAHISSSYHRKVGDLIKPNGIIILEGFSKSHLVYQKDNPNAGGPKNEEMLFSIEQIQRDFEDFDIIQLEEMEVDLSEGKFHNGKGNVIRFIGKKKFF